MLSKGFLGKVYAEELNLGFEGRKTCQLCTVQGAAEPQFLVSPSFRQPNYRCYDWLYLNYAGNRIV
jgi:hypothetical protein